MEWHNPFSQPLFWANLKKPFISKDYCMMKKERVKRGLIYQLFNFIYIFLKGVQLTATQAA